MASLNIKLGLVIQFVKAMKQDENAFQHICNIHQIRAKKAGILRELQVQLRL